MRSQILDVGTFGGRFHHVPDGLGRDSIAPDLTQSTYSPGRSRQAQFDALRSHELHQPFAVAADIALHFGQLGKVFAFGLRDVLSRDLRPSLCAPDVIRE
jgi:hypothetical protein